MINYLLIWRNNFIEIIIFIRNKNIKKNLEKSSLERLENVLDINICYNEKSK